jgi:hypothetical protein
MYRALRLAVLMTLTLFIAFILPIQSGSAQQSGRESGPAASRSSSAVDRAATRYKRHCRWDSYSSGGDYRTCIRVIQRTHPRFQAAWGYKYRNATPNWNQGSCTSKSTETFSWGGSVTVGVEAKAWIFAKVSASVSANFQKSKATERSTSPTFKLPPHSSRYCFDGVDFERYSVRRCTLSSYAPHDEQCATKSFRAPSIQTWLISTKNLYPGTT